MQPALEADSRRNERAQHGGFDSNKHEFLAGRMGSTGYRLGWLWRTGTRLWVVVVGHWVPATLLGAAAVAAAWPGLRRRRRRAAGMCPACGYDLRASTGRCPECGAIKSDDTPPPPRPPLRRLRNVALAASLAAMLFLLALLSVYWSMRDHINATLAGRVLWTSVAMASMAFGTVGLVTAVPAWARHPRGTREAMAIAMALAYAVMLLAFVKLG